MLECLASVGSSLSDKAARSGPEGVLPSLGTLAHIALEEWVRAGGWREKGRSQGIRLRWEEIGRKYGIDVNEVKGGRLLGITLSRFESKLAMMVGANPDATVLPEYSLIDHSRGVRGRVDLLLLSKRQAHVVEYKTGRDAWDGEGEPSRSARIQIAGYRMLAESEFPDRTVKSTLASPSQGFVELKFDPDTRAAIDASISDFRSRILRDRSLPASPDKRLCQLCPVRLTCEPQWQMAHSEDWPDFVDGVAEKVVNEHMATVSVLIDEGLSKVWIQGLDLFDSSSLIGRRVRAIRMRRRKTQDGNGPDVAKTGELSELSIS